MIAWGVIAFVLIVTVLTWLLPPSVVRAGWLLLIAATALVAVSSTAPAITVGASLTLVVLLWYSLAHRSKEEQ